MNLAVWTWFFDHRKVHTESVFIIWSKLISAVLAKHLTQNVLMLYLFQIQTKLHSQTWSYLENSQLGCRMLHTVSHTNDLFSIGFSLLGNFLKAVCTWQFAVVGSGLTKVKMISTGVLVCLWALSLTRVQMTWQIICANNGINTWYILSVRLLHVLTLQLLQTLSLQLLWNLDSPCWQNCMAILSQKTAISSVSFFFSEWAQTLCEPSTDANVN